MSGPARDVARVAALMRAVRGLLTYQADERRGLVQQLLSLGCAHLGMEIGVIAAIGNDGWEVTHVQAPASLGLMPGDPRLVDGAFCDAVVTERAIRTLDLGEHEGAHEGDELLFRSYVGAPVVVDGEVFGVLGFAHTADAVELSLMDVDTLGVLAGLASMSITRDQLVKELDVATTDLARLTQIDPLTQLYNRRGIEKTLDRLARRYRHGGAPFTAVLLDLDDFKHINDTFGHATGDDVLAKTAELIQAVVRPTDVVGRIGGDEFLALLPGTSLEQAHTIAERIRAKLDGDVIKVFGGTVTVTVTASIGLAEIRPDTSSVKDILAHTSSVLRTSKRSGKNQVSS